MFDGGYRNIHQCMIATVLVLENDMSRRTRFIKRILFPRVLFLALPLLLAACGRWTIEIVPPGTPLPTSANTPPSNAATGSPGNLVVNKDLTFSAAVPEFGTTETGKQDIDLGRIEQPGRYVLQLANDNPPLSNHWIEWDYLALKAGGSSVWQIGQEETPPVYGSQASDEFCGTAEHTDCRTGVEVIAGRVDERSFPKTLNDGGFPVIRIVFTVTPEQTGADLVVTLSTLYSSHVPDTKDFRMQVTLQGPY
jgi:hypothetical protein